MFFCCYCYFMSQRFKEQLKKNLAFVLASVCLYKILSVDQPEVWPHSIATAQNLTRSAKCGQQTLSHTPKKTWTMFVEF